MTMFAPDPLLYYKMIILRYHEIFFRLTAPWCTGMAAGAVSLKKSHDIVILSFCNIVKGQANSLPHTKNSLTQYKTPLNPLKKWFNISTLK